MLDFVIFLLLKYTYILAAVLLLIKTVLFVKNKNKNWTFMQFLYFNATNIQFTSSSQRARLKKVQNQLSIAIMILIVIQIGGKMMF
ncbi:MAG: hypothetical protein JWR18_2374 [Segetibacter sp.]|jgi:uncharacterized membrane protein|nr:hypothetical protein [Segetibacter sp.]